jgi:hypothetical protein
MSKRKPARTSGRYRGPKTTARAQRTKQAVVRSSKDNPPRSDAAGLAESSPKLHDDSKQELPKNRAAAVPGDFRRTIRDNEPKKGFDFSLAPVNVQAYQTKLLEMAQANVQLALEVTQRLVTMKSPFDFLSAIAGLTSKRIDIFRKYSKEMAELNIERSIL